MIADIPWLAFKASADSAGRKLRVVVVSHACSVDLNRDVYRALAHTHGHEVHVVIPQDWPIDFAGTNEAVNSPAGNDLPVYQLPVRLVGKIQRHFYRWKDIRQTMARLKPDVLLIEEEPFSVAGTQWAVAARRKNVPYALQAAENLADRVPVWLRPVVRRNLSAAGLVMARSHSAITVARGWGAIGTVEFIPHALPTVLAKEGRGADSTVASEPDSAFVIGFAGRLVPEKGIKFLVDVLLGLDPPRPVRLLVAGRGPEAHELSRLAASGVEAEQMTLAHNEMATFYGRLDVLVIPSRSTPTWTEQFGRVITEAACFGVPTIGSDSGEIPWVIGDLSAGQAISEDDMGAWRRALVDLMDDSFASTRADLRNRALERYSTQAIGARLDASLASWIGGS